MMKLQNHGTVSAVHASPKPMVEPGGGTGAMPLSGRASYSVGLATVILALAVLASGSMIYLLWRTPTLAMFHWLDHAGIAPALAQIRLAAVPHAPKEWILHSFPHAAWTVSGTIFMFAIWRRSPKRERFFWLFLFPILAFAGEMGQWFGWVPGTFDSGDLAAVLFAFLFSLSLSPLSR